MESVWRGDVACPRLKWKPEAFAVINTAAGLIVAVLITHYILPAFTTYEPAWELDIAVTLIYTAVSLIRNDVVYRLFHRFVK